MSSVSAQDNVHKSDAIRDGSNAFKEEEDEDDMLSERGKQRTSLYESKENSKALVNFIQNAKESHNNNNNLLRSNSYTIQDVERQRTNLKASFATELCDDDYRNSNVNLNGFKGRRMSKSLPELRNVQHFYGNYYPGFKMSEYIESESDDDSQAMHDIPSRPTWQSKLDYFLTALGFIGLGLHNMWRFPYFCYMHNGGTIF